jgi:hypothetical protein
MICQLRTALQLSRKEEHSILKQATHHLTQVLTKQAAHAPKTWASMVAQSYPNQEAITIRITDQKEQGEVAQMTGKEMADKLNIPGVTAVNNQGRGILKVYTTTAATRTQLEKEGQWVTRLGKSASITQKRYPILVHNMPRSLDISNTSSIQAIQKENAGHIQGLQIQSCAWLHRRVPEGKQHSALVCWVPSAEIADAAIEKGLLFEHSLKTVERHSSFFRMMQCFKCQAYGHQSTSCPNRTKCSKCSGNHTHKECKDKIPRCANCGQKHTAFDAACPNRTQAKNRAMQCKIMAPRLYKEEQGIKHKPIQKPETQAKGPNKRTRDHSPRPPGRPTFISQAGKASGQKTLSFGNSSQEPLGGEGDEETDDILMSL